MTSLMSKKKRTFFMKLLKKNLKTYKTFKENKDIGKDGKFN